MMNPSKIVCVGRNYAAHARELGNDVPERPLLFFKPPSSLVADGGAIELPAASSQVEFEGEIGVVVGTRLRRATPAEAARAIGGVCAANDVTARDLQKSDGQWARAKGFDTFCAVGNVVDAPADLSTLEVVTTVNGSERQRGAASLMVFDIPTLLAYISGIMTLEPGDLVLTGTPAGVGALSDGDRVEIALFAAGAPLSRVGNPVRTAPVG